MTPHRSLLACYVYFLAACIPARAQTIALTTGLGGAPFIDRNLPDGGPATHLVLEVFRSLGADVKLDWLPWRRGYSLTKSGVYQASFPYLETRERQHDFIFSDTLYSDFSYLWTRSDDLLSVSEPRRFKDRTICVPLGYHSPLLDLLSAVIAHGELRLERPDTQQRCLQMLAAGRVDALSGQEATIMPLVDAMGLTGRIVHDPAPLAKLDFHVIFARVGTDELPKRFNAALQRMKDDGRYAALMAR